MLFSEKERREKKALDNAGRTPELAQLRKMVAMLHTYGAGGVMILLGERGSGKKNMVQQLELSGSTSGMRVLTGSEDVGRKVLEHGGEGVVGAALMGR